MSNDQYIAGACNIGGAEVKRRWQGAIAGWFLYLIVVIWLVSIHATQTQKLIAFIPAYLAAIGFLQGRRKFCVAYGLMGIFNFDVLGKNTKVVDKEQLSRDRKYALKLLVRAALIAAALTLVIMPF